MAVCDLYDSKSACVYFLISGDRTKIKIGRTTDLRSRVSSLRQQLKDPKIKILGCICNITYAQSVSLETALHHKFKYCNILGEWFECIPIQNYILHENFGFPPKDWGCSYYYDI